MIGGRYPHEPGVQDNADGYLVDGTSTLAVWLPEAGHRTETA